MVYIINIKMNIRKAIQSKQTKQTKEKMFQSDMSCLIGENACISRFVSCYFLGFRSIMSLKGGKILDQKKMGGFLKELRKQKGMTQERLAEYLNVSGRTVSRWETGSNMPDLDILIQLADYYDVDIRELLDGERKSEKMNKEVEETILKVADYSNNEKQRLAKRMCIMFVIGVISFIIYLVMEDLGMADGGGATERIASFALGFPLGIMICGILYTSGWMMKMKAFKKKLLKKER